MADHSFTFKIVVIGDKGVGKSSLIRRFHNDTFDDKLPTTIGVDFFIHDLAIAGKTVKLQLWDTAGEERFRGALTKTYYRGAHAALVLFDLTDENSFNSISEHWLKEFYQMRGSDAMVMLLGNKCDLEKKVEETKIKEYISLHTMEYFETSAKDCTNVQQAFEVMARNLVECQEQYLSLPDSIHSGPGSFTLHGAYGVPVEPKSYWNYCCGSYTQADQS